MNIIISDNSRRERMLRREVDDGRRDIKRQKEREILRLYDSDVIQTSSLLIWNPRGEKGIRDGISV